MKVIHKALPDLLHNDTTDTTGDILSTNSISIPEQKKPRRAQRATGTIRKLVQNKI